MRKVVKIIDREGNCLPLEKMNILFVGTDYVLASYKGFGFIKNYHACDGYTVITEA